MLATCSGNFFEVFLSLSVGLDVNRPRLYFAPSISLQEPINRGVVNRMADPAFHVLAGDL
jgi:hypothetical protein